MFNTCIGRQPTVMKSVVESANSRLESADYSADSNADPAKVGAWVRALKGKRCAARESVLYSADSTTIIGRF